MESKPWEPPQRPDPNGGRMDGGRWEGTKTHPQLETPGSAQPMTETVRHDKARRRSRTRKGRRQREPAAQGICPHTPPARLKPQLKATRARVVSTAKRRQRRRWEAQPVRSLRRPRTAMGPQDMGGHSRRRGVKKPLRRESAEEETADRETEERGPPKRSRAPNANGLQGGEGRGEIPTQQYVPMARSKGEGGYPREDQRENPPRGGLQKPEGGSPRAL